MRERAGPGEGAGEGARRPGFGSAQARVRERREPTGPVRERVREPAGPVREPVRERAGPGEGAGDDPPATPVRQEVALFFVELGIGLLAEAWSQQDPCQTCGCEELVQVSEVRRSSDP